MMLMLTRHQHLYTALNAGNQVRSGQVRPARQWRARFRAQAQKAQYVHNCYLHAAEIDK